MNADLPVKTPEEDCFGYLPFAKQLAPNLILKSGQASLVAGIEAPWGAGKTSFLNLLRAELGAQPSRPLVLDYYPWLYSTVDALLLGFCAQLASQLGANTSPRYARFGNALAGLGTALSPFSALGNAYVLAGSTGLNIAGRLLARFGNRKAIDIKNARDRVQDAIDEFEQPIVIFVDDVDRLAPHEIRLLFQFLKAVAAFKGVSYAVAYDTAPVERALSFQEGLNGREYLKKFIQLPVRLPRVSSLLLQRYFERALRDLLRDVQPTVNAAEKIEMDAAARSAELLLCLRTPRDVVRIANVFRMRLADCRGEVSLDDVLIYIALELVCPEAVALVREHPSLFVSHLTQHDEFAAREIPGGTSTLFDRKDDAATRKQKLFEQLPPENKETASVLLNRLFGKRKGVPVSDARFASSAHGLIKLLYGGGSPLSFSVPEVVEFLSDRRREEILEPKVAGGVLKEWLLFASSMAERPVVVNPTGLATALVDATTITTDPDRYYPVQRVAADYLHDLLQSIEQPERLAYLTALVDQQTNHFVSAEVLRDLAAAAGTWIEGRSYPLEEAAITSEWKDLIPVERVPELQKRWIASVRSSAAADRLRAERYEAVVLLRWGEFSANDYSEPQQYVKNFCDMNDPLELLRKFSLGLRWTPCARLSRLPRRSNSASRVSLPIANCGILQRVRWIS